MRAGIALGSNIEPRLLFLQSARRELLKFHVGPGPVLCSKVYETAPLDCPVGSAPFLNAVLEINCDLAPSALFAEMRTIEASLGRTSEHALNAPRTIDLDLLYCDEVEQLDPDLGLPHPRLGTRRFVLQPLADIRPSLILPSYSKSILELLSEAPTEQNVEVYCDSIY